MTDDLVKYLMAGLYLFYLVVMVSRELLGKPGLVAKDLSSRRIVIGLVMMSIGVPLGIWLQTQTLKMSDRILGLVMVGLALGYLWILVRRLRVRRDKSSDRYRRTFSE